MKLAKSAKIEACVSKGKYRPVLQDVWLDVENKVVVSADGRCMAVLPVEVGEHDTTGKLTEEALKAARKLARGNTIEIKCNGAFKLANGATLPRHVTEDKFPNWKQVIPDNAGGFTVAFDARLLVKIQEAFGSEFVQLTFHPKDGELGAIAVKPNGKEMACDPAAYGVLMPARLT